MITLIIIIFSCSAKYPQQNFTEKKRRTQIPHSFNQKSAHKKIQCPHILIFFFINSLNWQ